MQGAVCLRFCEWTSPLLHPYFCVLRLILVLPQSTLPPYTFLCSSLFCSALSCSVLHCCSSDVSTPRFISHHISLPPLHTISPFIMSSILSSDPSLISYPLHRPAASPRATPPAAATVPNNRKTPLHQSTPLPSNKKSHKTQSEIQI